MKQKQHASKPQFLCVEFFIGKRKRTSIKKEYEENENIINDDEHVGLYEPIC